MFAYRSIRSMLQNLPISPPRFVENPNDRDTYRNLIQTTVCIGYMSIGILLWKSWGVGSQFPSLPPNKINTLKASLLKDLFFCITFSMDRCHMQENRVLRGIMNKYHRPHVLVL